MGLGGVDLSDEHGGDRTPFPVSCSICLEAVKESKDRSRAKLQCGHEFHLDCIGSAFNAKGVMQCPNCRKVEKGQWLYANGCRSFPEFGMDDWTHDEDVYDISYSEMPFGVQWCPFSGLARLTSFEEGESTASAHNDVFGHHAIFSEHTSASSAAHSCPYVPYFQQVQISSSNSVDSVSDGFTFHHWSGLSGPSDVSTSHAFPAVDLNYPSWDHHSPPFSSNISRMNGADQVPVSPGMLRSIRAESDGFPRNGAFAHPFFLGHGSTSRASSSAIPLVPPFLGGSRSHPRARLHSYGQPNSTAMRAPALSSTRRSTGPRVSAPANSVPSSSDHPGVYLISGSAGGNLPDTESNGGSRLYAWERDRLAPYPLAPPDSEQNWWGRFQQVPGGSDSGNRTGFWHRHSNERQSSQGRTESSFQPVHPPRMYPFI